MPAWGAYDKSGLLSRNDGPSIWMTPEDHRKTASWGKSRDAQAYRHQQKDLIDQGRFQDALQMDVDDLRSKFGNTYDPAIQQAQEYYRNTLQDRLSPQNTENTSSNVRLAEQLSKNKPASEHTSDISDVNNNT
jgi:hypothetical protein